MNYDDRNIRERARQLLAPEIESREAVFKTIPAGIDYER